ncbi:hypothetical protein [Sorangium cellulosum]|uniref:hypothetical protein n=1 Tax=Sorangium cellulosum TaxID=56 RepID=UPI000CF428A0|nr:hypothetical protein [Sorangium cellulosum]
MLFLVTHPPDPRPALVVETTGRIDADAIDRLKQRMFGFGCSNGLLFDAVECVILRDTYSSLGIDSLEEDGRVPTERLLALVHGTGRTIDQRVLDWLQSMAASWNTALPLDSDVAAPFITDIVPAVSGSYIREVA